MRVRTSITPSPRLTLGTDYLFGMYPQTFYDGPWVSTKSYCADELHHGPPWRSGGPLNLYRWDNSNCQTITGSYTLEDRFYKYVGGFRPYQPAHNYLTLSSLEDFMSTDQINASSYGSRAWNRFKPTRPGVSLAQSIAELREVPRMLKTSAQSFKDIYKTMGGRKSKLGPKQVANEFLNYSFGWVPFISDLRRFYQTTQTLDARLKQLRRDNGRWVRRRGTVTSGSTTTVVQNDYRIWHKPNLNVYLIPVYKSTGLVTRELTKRIWFSGAFRYYIPNVATNRWKGMSRIYGANITPSLVWELTPWSWLIDWYTDIGDMLSNVSDMLYDGLTAKYAYLMGTYEQNIRLDTGTFYGKNNSQSRIPIRCKETAHMIQKVRVSASPFGFLGEMGDLTARQSAILAALGLSRAL